MLRLSFIWMVKLADWASTSPRRNERQGDKVKKMVKNRATALFFLLSFMFSPFHDIMEKKSFLILSDLQ